VSVITVVFLVYLIILVAVAAWSSKESTTLEGYFIAGKKLPPWVVAFSTNATGESGWLLLGLTGMGYAVGAHAFWVVLGEVTGISLAWILISRRLKRLSDKTDSITVPDVLAARFNDKSHVLRSISVVIILVMVMTYVAAQMVATGKAFDGFTDLNYTWGVVVGATIIIAYTLVGGFKAVAWTDLIQGVLMLLGLIILPIVAINAGGGWDAISSNLAAQDPGLLSPWGPEGKSTLAIIGVISFVAIGVPFIGVPQLMVRFMSARSEKSLVPAMTLSVIVIFLFDMGAVLTGMAGRALFPGLEDPESILPVMSTAMLPEWMAGIMMVVVLAAIMSTVDSLLILASSTIVRDYTQKIRGSLLSDRILAKRGKLLTLVIGVIGVGFALQQSPMIFWFVVFAWNGLGAAFGPPLLCGLWYPRTNIKGAIAGMLGGFLTTVAWVLFFKEHFYNLSEIVPGFLVGLVLTIGVSIATSRNLPEQADKGVLDGP
jgi:sodium/proline symporter